MAASGSLHSPGWTSPSPLQRPCPPEQVRMASLVEPRPSEQVPLFIRKQWPICILSVGSNSQSIPFIHTLSSSPRSVSHTFSSKLPWHHTLPILSKRPYFLILWEEIRPFTTSPYTVRLPLPICPASSSLALIKLSVSQLQANPPAVCGAPSHPPYSSSSV